ncbi:5-carboxymethyl-2-hydroxymuconate Delta-isomerase [Paraburkholderia silvatlantica]|uniref:5-carboxymethyl-2-hydroxymuconate isomerase n=1 Tax=Paraburkholderia silvatlantica TaxID=321895 RepID=A0ABR6FW72_9BURK|nr:5-carboxymethyl-2-hydroxymuconate Delta-isomerase [Paraburkholderia silvatlantica]MBB2931681.1 5-carboxymethyl-2-hydroxymuconate isomerase [Paraburkholderia silvatlantica]PVY26329.1 5-carboxymethyl-2-hydroxymuconate delta isomerase [Paraburkholderia silvatlantica]PXW32080.1 5-carboxymethyl-2-hydroxymuconate delta isomerase [Paraburkholderia silvatlantica]TDQ82660.1 5-carboxymethyl-2-hydroxymuconate delta isomerase [Paraburkholderia silvatlantica]
MPHLTLEYSANLADASSVDRLCETLAHVLDAQRDEHGARVYPRGGIRTRALRCEHYFVADGDPANAFLHGCLKIGAGRSQAVRRATGDALFDAIKQHFAPAFASHGLALSLEIVEFGEEGAWKHNNLHARLKDASS